MSIDHNDFKNLFELTVAKLYSIQEASSILNKIKWDVWINKSGYPPIEFNFGIYKLIFRVKFNSQSK